VVVSVRRKEQERGYSTAGYGENFNYKSNPLVEEGRSFSAPYRCDESRYG